MSHPPLSEDQAREEMVRVGRSLFGRGYEYMDLESDAVATAASSTGAKTLGFAGTRPNRATSAASGLTALAEDEFGGGARLPMMPRTWAGETSPDEEESL